MRIPERLFGRTRTVVWAYANGCLGIRKRLFGRMQTVITLCQTPCNSVPFSCFRDTYFFKKGLWGAPGGHLRGTLLGLECPLQRAYSQRVRPKGGTGGTLFLFFHTERTTVIGHTDITEGSCVPAVASVQRPSVARRPAGESQITESLEP